MNIMGYILDTPITAIETISQYGLSLHQGYCNFLQKGELTSAYQIYNDMKVYWNPDDYISYKNTNKKVHKLNELGLIKVQKKIKERKTWCNLLQTYIAWHFLYVL